MDILLAAQSLVNSVSLKDILNGLLFLFLSFLGVATRAMIEIERYDKHFKDIKFFNRYFLATVLAFVLQIQLKNTAIIKDYYSEVIILFCIFVNDIVKFVFDNKWNVLLYLLNTFTKGISDIKKYLIKNSKIDNDSSRDNK